MIFLTNFENPITGKTISQNQANKIKTVINKAIPKIEKIKTITERCPKIYMGINRLGVNHINPLTSLVDNRTITQSQADKIIMKQIYLYYFKYNTNISTH